MKKQQKYSIILDLQQFAEDGAAESGVESASAAEMPNIEESADQTGVESQAAAEPTQQNNFEKAFAKRLAAEREKWERETSEKYKDYEVAQKAMQYVQRTSGISDTMTLKEQLELVDLQERAERENVPPEVLKRLDELEAKAARVDQFEQQQQQAQWQQTYFGALGEFANARGVESDKLNQFMIDNSLTVDPNNMNRSFEIALKAMKYDDLEREKQEAEKNGMKKLIAAKGSIPTVPGSNAQGQVISAPPKTFAEARARAMQRMSGE